MKTNKQIKALQNRMFMHFDRTLHQASEGDHIYCKISQNTDKIEHENVRYYNVSI